ncbi:MAG: hypothetical protein LBP50_09560, partial [Tannerella sp.]|nr:hypothetical protein [Tannerella sp.]
MDEREDIAREKLIAYLERVVAELKRVFGNTYVDAFGLTEVKNALESGEPFTWKGNPAAERKLNALLRALAGQTEHIIRNGIAGSWKLGESDVKDAVLYELGKDKNSDEVNRTLEQAVKDRRADGMNAHRYATQKRGGMNLSERVWNLTGEAKKEIERIVQSRIAEGKSADGVSRDIRKYLNEPERSTKTVPVPVRDKNGHILKDGDGKVIKRGKIIRRQAYVDETMNDYHPGRGVYRSAYKNALRLARTEINAAYRRAERENCQNDPLIKGYRILLSNNHTTLKNGKPVPFTDMCDDLQGDYPKWFLWEGWHPQCRCRMIPIVIGSAELGERAKARREGRLDEWKPKGMVEDVPENFKKWIAANRDRIARAEERGTTPYFIRDNYKNGRIDDGFVWQVKKRIKTDAEKAAIQRRWNERRKHNALVMKTAGKVLDVAKAFPEMNASTLAELIKTGQIAKIQEETRRIAGLVSAAKKEERRLSELIPDVKKWKAEFGVEKVRDVYAAVEKKLKEFGHLPLAEQVKKLEFEIDWVEQNRKYDTWHVAQDSYKKQLAKVEYLISKKNIELTTTHALGYADTTKSANLKKIAIEYKALLNANAPISTLKAKADVLNAEVARLEAAKAKRANIKLGSIDESKYTQERKNKAIWIKSDRSKADDEFRGRTEKEWASASQSEKIGATKYTGGSGSFNRPLRGFDGDWYNYKGVGNVDLNNEGAAKDIQELTNLINKSISTKDTWLQRGIGSKRGTSNFLG